MVGTGPVLFPSGLLSLYQMAQAARSRSKAITPSVVEQVSYFGSHGTGPRSFSTVDESGIENDATWMFDGEVYQRLNAARSLVPSISVAMLENNFTSKMAKGDKRRTDSQARVEKQY